MRRFDPVALNAEGKERLAWCERWAPGFKFGLTDLIDGLCHMWSVEIDGEHYASAVLASANMPSTLLLQAKESLRHVLRSKLPQGARVPDHLLDIGEWRCACKTLNVAEHLECTSCGRFRFPETS